MTEGAEWAWGRCLCWREWVSAGEPRNSGEAAKLIVTMEVPPSPGCQLSKGSVATGERRAIKQVRPT